MRIIEQVYTKKDILEMLKSTKTYKYGVLGDNDIDRKMKLKPNNPAFYSVKIELDDNFNIVIQHNNDEEFPKYTAILLSGKTNICRLDYHDGHRRKCKKEIFLEEIYEDLHLHLYCDECIRERFKSDAFVLNVKLEKMMNFDFKCFVTLFCEIIHLESNLDCQRSLFS